MEESDLFSSPATPSVPPAPPVAAPPARPAAVINFPKFYKKASLVFLLLAVVTLGLVAYAIMGRATVVVLAKPDDVKSEFVMDVAAKPQDGDVPGAVLSAGDSLSRSFPTTEGTKVAGRAVAKVRITSTLGYPQTLVATTRLLTPDGVLFRLEKRVTVPANGSVTALADADELGAGGDVGTTTFTIPGLRPETQRYFQVTTVEPPSGGEVDQSVLTQSDVDAAVAVLRGDLEKQLTDQLRAQAQASGTAASGELTDVAVTSQQVNPAMGATTDDFRLTVTIKVTAVFYDRDKLLARLRELVKRQLPAEREIRQLNPAQVTIKLEKADVPGGQASLRVDSAATAAITSNVPALARTKLVGISVEAAKRYLEEIDGVASASITVSPVWSRSMPNVPDHIDVEVR